MFAKVVPHTVAGVAVVASTDVGVAATISDIVVFVVVAVARTFDIHTKKSFTTA